MKQNTTTYTGVSFEGLLQLAFIILKLTNIIKWSWLWVLSPTWIPLCILLVILLIIAVIE